MTEQTRIATLELLEEYLETVKNEEELYREEHGKIVDRRQQIERAIRELQKNEDPQKTRKKCFDCLKWSTCEHDLIKEDGPGCFPQLRSTRYE